MQVSPEQAAIALAEVEKTREAMRRLVREHRGHYHLWIWGVVWIAMPLSVYFGGERAARYFPWICLAGAVAAIVTGFLQARQIRQPANFRVMGAIAILVGFAVLFPFVL